MKISEIVSMGLSNSERSELNEIRALVDRIRALSKSGTNEEKEEFARALAKKQITLKALVPNLSAFDVSESDKDDIMALDSDVTSILQPIYDRLLEGAMVEMHNLYKHLRKLAGESNPKLHGYQLDLARYILKSVINNGNPDDILTLLVSRGAGRVLPLKC